MKRKSYRNLMRTMTRKGAVKELDRVFSLYIRKRDKYCVLCGTTDNLTAGHLFSRVAYSTRWDETNTFAQCSGCNLGHEHNPHIFTLWYIKKFGIEQYDKLFQRHSQIKKFTNQDLQKLILYYNER